MSDPGAVRNGALEDIAFLSRSKNRVRVLTVLAEKAYPRRELEEVTETSRTTLGRILGEFEDRRWVERTADGDYVATPNGELIVAEFTPFVDAMVAIKTLDDAAACLPVDELQVGVQHFIDATIRRPQPNTPFGLVEHIASLVREASTFRVLTFLAPPSPIGGALHSGVVNGCLTAEHVLAGGVVEYLRTQEHHPPHWYEYIDAGARMYRYDGHIPCNLFIIDDTVLILKDQPEDGGLAIETENETVREDMNELFERYREEGESVGAEMFA